MGKLKGKILINPSQVRTRLMKKEHLAHKILYFPQNVFLFCLYVILFSGFLHAGTRGERPLPPRLIVFISVDQLRTDLVFCYESHFGSNGFRRLIRESAVMTSCRYEYITCHTSAGHATMVSGTYPSVHGIVGNHWYDRQANRIQYSVGDPTGVEPGDKASQSPYGLSNRNFMGTTIGDELKLFSHGLSLVYSVSNKDRSAVLMAGKLADGAFWWNLRNGQWISSKQYMEVYPDWLNNYNQTRPLDAWFGQSWELLLDSTVYPKINSRWISAYDQSHDIGLTFPHRIGSRSAPDSFFYKELMTSPFASVEINRFVSTLFKAEPIGKDSIPDLLCISYSAGDYIGHQFGPYSRETMDYLLRMDRCLDTLFQIVERHVGLSNTLIVLTSDHGLAPIPETLEGKNFGTLRVNIEHMAGQIHDRMTARYGKLSGTKKYVVGVEPAFYFNPEALKEKKIEKEEAERYIKKLMLNEQWNGIERVYTHHELMTGAVLSDEITTRVMHSFYPSRSGDLIVLLKPFHIWDYTGKGTEHGQWYSYDAHVPLFFWGHSWFLSGFYHQSVSPVDIAPTLSVILGTAFPSGCIGKVIDKILR